MNDRYYPSEKNLGKDCEFWQSLEGNAQQRLVNVAMGCIFPKYEMEGRVSCEGIIDDVCLYLKDGRMPKSLTEEQLNEIRFKIPDGNNRDLPPGDAS
jgi:hypothetical protein